MAKSVIEFLEFLQQEGYQIVKNTGWELKEVDLLDVIESLENAS